jgi:ribosomal-protein-alanine N-acetyltransferase
MTGECVTERLRLVPIAAEHADDLWMLHQQPGVAQWWAGAWSKEQARRFAAECGSAWQSRGVHKWIAYDRQTGELVGRGGLSRAVVDGEERLELGWTISEKLWGRGYATEIGRAGLAFAFNDLGADEVVAFTETNNERSIAVMRRLHMRYRGEILHDGQPFVLYAITRRP